MKVSVTGVLEDGTPRLAGIPSNPRKHISMHKGGDLQIDVTVVTPIGAPVSLNGDGTELLLTVKRRPYEHPPNIVKKASLSGNTGTFLLGPGDTKRLQSGMYGWDVWLTKDGFRDPVVPLSPFNIQDTNAAIPSQPPPQIVTVFAGDTDPLILDFAPINITGWTIELLVGQPANLTLLATITNGNAGIAQVDLSTVPVGKYAAQVRSTDLVPVIKTSDVFILNVLQPVVP